MGYRFIAIDQAGTHWIVEVKMDREMTSDAVLGKRAAARPWANYVSADEKVTAPWHYLLVSEADVSTAKASHRRSDNSSWSLGGFTA